MPYTRKEFIDLAARGIASAAMYSSFDFLGRLEARQASAAIASSEVKKVHDYIAKNKETHIATVQRDLRQPSISSWQRGVKEMAQLMMESFKQLGCRELRLVPTSMPEWPGVLASYDVGAPKTIVVYMMYDTQPFDEARWASPPLQARRVRNFAGFGEEKEALLRDAYGANYDRLVALKGTYDPGNLFRMNLNIPPAAAAAV